MKPKVPESGVLRACLDLLAVHKIWHRRWNTGAVKAGSRFFRFGKPGDADILAVVRVPVIFLFCDMYCVDGPESIPWPLWIECKGSDGKQRPEQIEFEKEVSGQGHHYLVVRDVNTLAAWLKEHGAI